MKPKEFLHYTYIFPVVAVLYYFSGLIGHGVLYDVIAGILLTGSVLSAVHHAEMVAHKVGEPFGTIILALCITIIEVALIISLMVAGGDQAITLARDTVFAAVMLILNGILGICILVGGVKYYEQFFARSSATTYLVSIVSILILTLVLPNFTSSVNGPFYNNAQLIFVSIACLVIYGIFLMVQTVRHRSYFVVPDEHPAEHYVPSMGQNHDQFRIPGDLPCYCGHDGQRALFYHRRYGTECRCTEIFGWGNYCSCGSASGGTCGYPCGEGKSDPVEPESGIGFCIGKYRIVYSCSVHCLYPVRYSVGPWAG
ncbi:hypothetical protein QE442_000725 [Chryseobacterium sp. SORGH_AS1175]|nr:hypothetical protein [Chryseobacterium sp. SORGH_AS_1175]